MVIFVAGDNSLLFVSCYSHVTAGTKGLFSVEMYNTRPAPFFVDFSKAFEMVDRTGSERVIMIIN